MKRPAILVTGAPRSGTTFLGKMLALASGVVYVDEPYNLQTGIEGIEQQFIYLRPGQSDTKAQKYHALTKRLLSGHAKLKPSVLRQDTHNPLRRIARDMLVSRENMIYKMESFNPLNDRYLIKDPMACFLAEYLHHDFGLPTVVIMRHPASNVASFKRLGWRFNLDELKCQPELMEDYLGDILKDVDAKKVTPAEEGAYLWLAIYHTLDAFMQRNPDIQFVTHEQLSQHPHDEIKKLYQAFGLRFTPEADAQITAHTNTKNPTNPTDNAAHVLKRNSSANIHRWKRILTPEEINVIRAITDPIASKYYTSQDWN